MNIDTGAIKREAELTPEEKRSGKWLKLADLPRAQRIKLLARLRAKQTLNGSGKAGNLGVKLTDGVNAAIRRKNRAKAEVAALESTMRDCLSRGLCRIYRDGNEWCAVMPDFVNLQESPFGVGPTKLDAFIGLRNEAAKAQAMSKVASDAPACSTETKATDVAADKGEPNP